MQYWWMSSHTTDTIDPERSPADDEHVQRWLEIKVQPWPEWDGLTSIDLNHTDTNIKDGAASATGWKVRKSKSHRPRRQQPRIDKNYALTLRQYKKHVRARDCVQAFLSKEKAKLPRRAHNKVRRFEDALISRMDQERFAEIRAGIDDYMDDVGGREKREVEGGDESIDDLLHELQALDIKKEVATAPKPSNKRVTVASLLREFALPSLPKLPPRKAVLSRATQQTRCGASRTRAPTAEEPCPAKHKNFAPATFATSVIKPGFTLTPSTDPGKVISRASSTSSLSSSITFLTVPEEDKTPRNPFYANTLTFSKAMQHIIDILSAADRACRYWLPLPEKRAMEVMTGGTSAGQPMIRLQRDFEDVCQFLTTGRDGWDLTEMP